MPTDERHARVRSSRVVLAPQMLALKFATMRIKHCAGGGGKRALAHRGEREAAVKPLRREGRSDSAATCSRRARAYFFSRRGLRVSGETRSSLGPRFCRGRRFRKARTLIAPRGCEGVSFSRVHFSQLFEIGVSVCQWTFCSGDAICTMRSFSLPFAGRRLG